MKSITFDARDEFDTQRLAQALAKCLPPETVVVLTGTLGSGKTALVRHFAAANAIDEQIVTSPTYVLCQEYSGDRRIHHLDVYRLNDEEEFGELGPDEIFASADVTFIEWGERVANYLPDERLEIHIDVIDQHARSFRIAATGKALSAATTCLATELRDNG